MANSLKVGGKLQAALARISAVKNISMKVGILNSATNSETGELIAPYAAANEFGALVKVEARKSQVHFKQAADGSVGNRFVSREKSNFVQDVTIPAHNIIIPARPFFRNTIKAESDKWAANLTKKLAEQPVSKESVRDALQMLGGVMVADIQNTIIEGNFVPISNGTWATKKRKGIANPEKPLVETGSMENALSFEIMDGSK
ncbi:hypothetical protein [Serratia sp. M24T3]|uniref:hypothetical protein n=1 Tax=Serratia sp. M24T3 TaxID=932213 RepID=UPI00025B8F3E|nr:hypothetical protein [Serratia sp. M24T3]EIC83988.1 hypothetical protein SPM24T3_13765 [Serratia sp. M24T3]